MSTPGTLTSGTNSVELFHQTLDYHMRNLGDTFDKMKVVNCMYLHV
jgi:hypothetical protein